MFISKILEILAKIWKPYVVNNTTHLYFDIARELQIVHYNKTIVAMFIGIGLLCREFCLQSHVYFTRGHRNMTRTGDYARVLSINDIYMKLYMNFMHWNISNGVSNFANLLSEF